MQQPLETFPFHAYHVSEQRLSKDVSTGVHTFGRTCTLAVYGVLYQCDSGYAGTLGET